MSHTNIPKTFAAPSSFERVIDLNEVSVLELLDGRYINEKGFIQLKNDGKHRMFKLSDVLLEGLETNYKATNMSSLFKSEAPKTTLKLPIHITNDHTEKIDQWYAEAFPGLAYKPSELYKDESCKDAYSCKPYKQGETGSNVMRSMINADTLLCVNGKAIDFLSKVDPTYYRGLPCTVYVWVSSIWLMNGTYGYKFVVTRVDVTNNMSLMQ